MELADKLIILADAAKYDVSCASSRARKRSAKGTTVSTASIAAAATCRGRASRPRPWCS